MQDFIITITYTDGTVDRIPAHCTIEQVTKAMEAYRLFAKAKSVVLQYK